MRILFVSCDPLEGAVTRYRCTHLAEALKSAGHTADVATIYDPVIRLEHDIVVLHRICANAEGQALANAVRKSGATLIYGADDLVFEEGLHLAMLQQADGVLVSTNALAKFASEAGAKSVRVVRNWAIEDEFESEPLQTGGDIETVRLLYGAGTQTHDQDLNLLALPLEELLETGWYDERLVLAGNVACPLSLQKTGRVQRWPWSAWEYYIALIHGCDIILAPLEPTAFNSGKSELKWLEAAMCHKPTIASRWGGFAEVVTEGKDGLLAATSEEWEKKLLLLIEDERLRVRMGKAAYMRAKKQAREQAKATVAMFQSWQTNQAIQRVVIRNYRGWLKGKIKSILRKLER